MTRAKIENEIYIRSEKPARDYWDGAGESVRGEIRDVYDERGIAAAVEYLRSLAVEEDSQ